MSLEAHELQGPFKILAVTHQESQILPMEMVHWRLLVSQCARLW
jgi:hypothetical protein